MIQQGQKRLTGLEFTEKMEQEELKDCSLNAEECNLNSG